jgi:outer membrane protein
LSFQKLAAVIGMSREQLTEEDLESETAKPFLRYEPDLPDIKPQNHRQAKIYDLQGREAALSTRLVQRNDWPQLQLSGAAGYHNNDYIDNPASTGIDMNRLYNWNAMVTLSYNLWDWGIRDRELQQARISESNTNRTNAQAMFDLGTTLRDLGNQLRSLRANVKLTRELMAGEQQSYSILETEYRDGKSSYLDLITNLNSLIDSRSKYIVSYFGFRKAQALYSFHKGDLYKTLRE